MIYTCLFNESWFYQKSSSCILLLITIIIMFVWMRSNGPISMLLVPPLQSSCSSIPVWWPMSIPMQQYQSTVSYLFQVNVFFFQLHQLREWQSNAHGQLGHLEINNRRQRLLWFCGQTGVQGLIPLLRFADGGCLEIKILSSRDQGPWKVDRWHEREEISVV